MKKFMKILTALLSVSMALSVMPPALAADGLILSEPTYTLTSGGSETTIPAPKPGFVTTTIDVTNQGEADANACLVVVATDNTTGKLVAVDADNETVPKKGSATLSKGVNLGSGQTYKYYVWDSVMNHKPLTNTPPTTIKNFVCAPKTNSVDLSWDECLDDKGIKNYIVKLNGKEVAKPKTASYSVPGLDKNSSYDFEVSAYDEEGLTSNVVTAKADTYGIEELILNDGTNASGSLSFIQNNTHETLDSYTEFGYYAERPCFTSKKLEAKGYVGFFYFPVNSAYIPSSMNKVGIEVTYFDNNTNNFSLRYDCEAGGTKTKAFDNGTNTGTWKTTHIELDDACFVSSLSDGSSMRIESPAGTKIYKIAVAPGDKYAPDSPHVTFGEFTTDTYDMAFYPADATETYGMFYENIDGTYCMYSSNGKSFEFNIADDYATRTGGYIEVTYYDDSDDTLVLKYPTVKEEDALVPFENTKTFRTVQIPLEAATFDNSIAGAKNKKFDFKLSTKNGNSLAISSVKYVPGDSDYVPVPVTEISSQMNEDGTAFEGKLTLNSTFNYTPGADGYDMCALYSGTAGRSPLVGKHYIFNKDYGDSSWKKWKNAFYINVPKSFLNGVNTETIEIIADVYTTKGKITIEYKGGAAKKTVSNIPTNTWTTATFTITPADAMEFNTGYNGTSASFRFMAEGEELKINKVTIKKVD